MGERESDIASMEAPDGLSLVRTIGSGSMATVYLARDENLKRLVALKVLKPELASDPVSAERFEREARAAARLSHPNVTQVYSVGRLPDGSPYICMEYVEGRDLDRLTRSEGPFEHIVALKWMIQLARALACSHENGIIHRDIKPANVIVSEDGERAVLTDFGVAGIRETGSEAVTRLTRAGERFGDPRYMSPEQHRGEPVSPQSDVYSFSVIGYELLTGRGPFGKDDNENIAAAHLRATPFDLHDMDSAIPIHIADTLRRCLAKQPDDRPRIGTVLRNIQGDNRESSSGAEQAVFATFLSELGRRKVYRTGAAYIAMMVVFLQAADAIIPATPLPDWSYPALVTTFLCGLPLILVLSWLFDIRDGKISRTESLQSKNVSRALVFAQVAGVLASISVAVLLGWWMLG